MDNHIAYAQHCLDWVKNAAERALQAAVDQDLQTALNETYRAQDYLKIVVRELKATMKRRAKEKANV